MSDHKYRFGTTGKPLAAFFKRRNVREKRYFPKTHKAKNDVMFYVESYFKLNCNVIQFVESNYD